MRISDGSSDVCSSDLADDIGANLASPTDTHPCQCANLPITGLATFGLGMVRAVRRKVQPPHRPAPGGLFRAYLEHVSFVVLRLRMVDLMHANGIRVVVDRNVNMLARSEERRVGKECVSTCRR